MAAKVKKGDEYDVMDSINEINPYATYLNESTLSHVTEWIDTGSMVLNALISGSLYKGVPVGRVIQFAGPSQTLKTTFALQIAANAQKMGKYIIIFDSEGAIDPESAEAVGLDLSKCKYVPIRSIEETRNIIYQLGEKIKEKKLEGQYVIIVDSLANSQSELELKRMDKDNTSADMGTFAKAIKSLLKTCTNVATFTRTTTIVTNHVYDDPSAQYPSLEKHMAGGKTAVYLPSVTVQLARKLIKDEDASKVVDTKLAASQKNYSGVAIRLLTAKNRFIKQYLEGEIYVSFSKGMDKYYGLLELLKGMGVVTNAGAWYTDWEGNKLGTYKTFFKDRPLLDDRLLPYLETRILSEWKYGNLKDEDDVPLEEDEEELVEEVESPMEKLKKLKSKVTALVDQAEAESEDGES